MVRVLNVRKPISTKHELRLSMSHGGLISLSVAPEGELTSQRAVANLERDRTAKDG